VANPKLTDQQCKEAVDALQKHGSKVKAAAALGIPAGTFYNRLKEGAIRLGQPQSASQSTPQPVSTEAAVETDRRVRTLVDSLKLAKEKYQQAEKELLNCKARNRIIDSVSKFTEELIIKPNRSDSNGEAAVIALASDWHVEERVDPWTIGGVHNEYNLEISAVRAGNFFKNLLTLTNQEAHFTSIKNIVLWLGGDLITGYIHEELQETNYLSPVEAIWQAKKYISGGIRFLLKESPYAITIPCSQGNHGRTTLKRRVSTYADNSFEFLLYLILADEFRDEKRVTFKLTKAYLNYVQVFGIRLRFHHGDNVQFNGGVGGLTVPMNKKIAKWNEARHAHYDCIGHFHQMFDGGKFLVNGSMIGYNPYAESIGASPEPPQQTMFLLDKKETRKTKVMPIYVHK